MKSFKLKNKIALRIENNTGKGDMSVKKVFEGSILNVAWSKNCTGYRKGASID
jgi:hypothetical protein